MHTSSGRVLLFTKLVYTTDHFRRCIALCPAANATPKLTYEALHPTAYSSVPYARSSLRSLRFRRRVSLALCRCARLDA